MVQNLKMLKVEYSFTFQVSDEKLQELFMFKARYGLIRNHEFSVCENA